VDRIAAPGAAPRGAQYQQQNPEDEEGRCPVQDDENETNDCHDETGAAHRHREEARARRRRVGGQHHKLAVSPHTCRGVGILWNDLQKSSSRSVLGSTMPAAQRRERCPRIDRACTASTFITLVTARFKVACGKSRDKLIERANVAHCSGGFAEAVQLRRRYAVMKEAARARRR